MELLLEEIKKIVDTHPDYSKGDFEIKQNKGFKTLYFCDIAVIKVIQSKNENRLEMAKKYFALFGLDLTYYLESESTTGWIRIENDDNITNLIYDNAKKVFKRCYKDSAEIVFGCCSRFIECSDAKQCTCKKELNFNNVKRFPSGCMYKDNLDRGLVFYGKNKNYPLVKNGNQED